MFPVDFDHSVLDTLPMSLEKDVKRVVHVLQAIAGRRLIPYFRRKRGTDWTLTAGLAEHWTIERLDDESNRVRSVSLLSKQDGRWLLQIHERIFDYLAFVIPSHPEASLAEGSPEEAHMLAFTELMLRHEIHHMLYPTVKEGEVIRADAAFSMDRRENDPTFYRALRSALTDRMNGLSGQGYLDLLDAAEIDQPLDRLVSRIVGDHVTTLADLPEDLIQKVFPSLCTELQSRILGLCYQMSRDTSISLLRRTQFLQKFLRLFEMLVSGNLGGVEEVFDAFREHWGLTYLFRELGLQDADLDARDKAEVFELFKSTLKQFAEQTKGLFCGVPAQPVAPRVEPKPPEIKLKSLQERITDARNNPDVPAQVMQVIDKNRAGALGQSGSKYAELIETLLAVPWGKTRKIEVSPEAFEAGLNRSHYGLHRQKEMVFDLFSGLLWRYQHFGTQGAGSPVRGGSAFLFVGPPGVGKTSLAISIARNLGLPVHKLSLGGMRDEADLRGHSFTYEGSKPGAIVQGLIKMGCMNGMFIMDEADKTEKFAIATLLEILDPEQNHLFHDKYIQTTVDIDLSNCLFVLTANTLETVPAAVVNRCEVVFLDRYSVDEKITIARTFLVPRVREGLGIDKEQVFLDPQHEAGLVRFLVQTYTREAGVRELERALRTLFVRVLRKDIIAGREPSVKITREKIIEYLDRPRTARLINADDRVGEIMALGISVELGIGSVIPVQATPIQRIGGAESRSGYVSMVHATGNIEKVMDESRKVATTAILHRAEPLGIRRDRAEMPIHLHFMGGSTPKDGPSAGGAIALALASVLSGRRIRRDVAMTGEIDTQGRITVVGGLDVKLETAYDAGCRTLIIPRENLESDGGLERLSEGLKREVQIFTYEAWKGDREPFDYSRHVMQIVAIDHILQAAEVAFLDQEELQHIETCLVPHARSAAKALAATREPRVPPLRIFYIKGPQELASDGTGEPFWETPGSYFIVRSPEDEAVRKQLPILKERMRLWRFDPSSQHIAETIGEVAESFRRDFGEPGRSTLVAPFFFLQQELSDLERLAPGGSEERLRLFANNYSLQGAKIRGCKAVLNRLFFYLSQLEPEQLDSCPFLSRRNGVFLINMSFVPEKYRLDLKRAETILTRSLQNWLATVTYCGQADQAEPDMPQEQGASVSEHCAL